jgi:hypothetical protein
MLSISYSQCLADPTYCDTGKKGGFALMKRFGVKPNEPRPLHQIFQWLTIAELLWLLRAVKDSQKEEALDIAVAFVATTLRTMPYTSNFIAETQDRRVTIEEVRKKKLLALNDSERKQWWALEQALNEGLTMSQIAIDVSEAAMTVAAFAGQDALKAEELRQRNHIKELLQ